LNFNVDFQNHCSKKVMLAAIKSKEIFINSYQFKT
jgi:hypothetical protein